MNSPSNAGGGEFDQLGIGQVNQRDCHPGKTTAECGENRLSVKAPSTTVSINIAIVSRPICSSCIHAGTRA